MGKLILLFLAFTNSLTVAGPDYPPNAIAGGTVVAELQFSSGRVTDIRILDGEGAFADASREALAQWRRDAGADASELVVVRFRSPYLYLTGSPDLEVRTGSVHASLPYPRRIWEPAYPANVMAQGSVVLRVKISASGDVTDAAMVQELGGLTEASVEAVRKWKFRPAEDRNGNAARSEAYVVMVYRFPVATNSIKTR